MKKILTLSFLTIPVLFLAGCDRDSLFKSDPCASDPDAKHCYQAEAVAAGDASLCKKIDGKEFKQYGSNPPRDKCYMMVAAETNNYNLCDQIKGGEMSYTKEDCVFEVISKNDDPS